MRLLITLILSLTYSLCFSLLSAQPSNQWIVTYGASDDDMATDAVIDSDGNIIVTGILDDDETGRESISLRKFSVDGEELFAYLLRDGSNNIATYGLEVRPDGTMITGGLFSGDAFLTSVGPDGTVNKTLLDPTYNLWDITTGSDGNIVACGDAANGTIIRAYNDSLEVVWENVINISGIRDAVSIVALADGGYALLCASNERGGDVAVVRTDNQGQVLWSRIYGGTRAEIVDINNDPGPNIMQTPDGGLVFGATAGSADGDVTFPDEDNNRNNFWVVKVDEATGDIVWNTILAVGICNGINVKLDGTILAYGRGVSGAANNVPSNVPDGELGNRSSVNWIGSLNEDGSVAYSYHFISDAPHTINQVVNYPDGTWAVLGRTRSEEPPFTNVGRDDLLVMRFDDGTVPLDDNSVVGRLDTLLCSNAVLEIGGEIFDVNRTMGEVVLTGQAADGGDSTVMVTVEFYPLAQGAFSMEVCPGESVVIAGSTYEAGNFPETITLPGAASSGCDSTVNVTITILSENDPVCGGDGNNPGDAGFECLPTSNPLCLSQEQTTLGGQACVDFSASNFEDIIAFQFSVEFDPEQIGYSEIVLSDQLPGLSVEDNFELQLADEGIISLSYNLLTGESLTFDDGTSLFQICFSGLSGGLAPVTVSDTILGSTVILYSDFSESDYAGNTGSVEVILCSDTTVTIDTLLCLGETVTFDNTSIGAAGTYTQTIQIAGGCDSTTILNVAINEVEFSFPSTIGFCPGETRIVSGPDSVVIGLLATPDDMLAANLVLPLGESTIKILELNGGCIRTQEVNVFEFTPPTVEVTGAREYCENETGTFISASGAQSYLWSTGDTSATVFLAAGIYTVTGTDDNGCATTEEITIETLPLPTLGLEGALTYCSGDEGATVMVTGAQTYTFSTGVTASTATFVAGEYFVVGTGVNGCSDTLEFVVEELPLPAVEINGATEYCANGEGVILTASGGVSYLWSDGTEGAVNNVSAGEYTVTVTGQNGCSSVESVTVTELELPEIDIEGSAFYCAGESGATVTATGGETYVWSTDEEVATVTLEAGTYMVTATDGNGCEASTEIVIIENPLPVVQILGDPNICPQDGGAVLTATGGNFYQWSTGATTASIVAPVGTYGVTVSDDNGCSASSSITVVGDTISPIILACPTDRRGVLNFEQTEVPISWNEPFAEDNCGVPALSGPLGGANGALYPEGTTTITYEAVDEAGNSSACTFNVIVERSDDLTFYVDGDGTTVENGVFCIPVRVRDFTEVVTFGVAFSLPNIPGVEYVATVPGQEVSATAGEGFFAAQSNGQNEVAVTYLNAQGAGLTLSDEALAFTIKVTLPGNPGDCFAIGTVLDLISVEAFQLGIGETVPTLIPGEVCVPNSFQVAGRTYRPNPELTPIDASDVELESSDGSDDFDITDLAGRYSFEELDGNVMHTFTPERDFEHNGGYLSVIDMAVMIFHIRGIDFITDPYQIIAANVNDDSRISLLDISPVRQVILGSIGEFPENASWRFLPVDYTIDPLAPINDYEESVTLPGLDQDEVVDFYGVKIGDLNNSQPNFWGGSGEEESVSFSVQERWLTAGEEVRVAVQYAGDQPRLLGYQQSWAYAPSSLSLVGTSAGDQNDKDLAVTNNASRGLVRALYLDHNPAVRNDLDQVPNSEVLVMHFKVHQSGWLSDVLTWMPNDNMPSLAAVGNHPREVGVSIAFQDKDNLAPFAVAINPNPVSEAATATLSLPREGSWELNLVDLQGRVIGVTKGVAISTGKTLVEVPGLGNLQPGTYYLRLQSGDQTVVTSLIKQ